MLRDLHAEVSLGKALGVNIMGQEEIGMEGEEKT